MRKLALMFFISAIYSTNVFSLSPDIKFDILKTKLTQELKANEYSQALGTMAEIRSLGVKVPKSFDYFEGKALFESGQYEKSYKKLEQYIGDNGQKGKYYKQAIAYLIKAEESVAEARINDKKAELKKHSDTFKRILKSKLTNYNLSNYYSGKSYRDFHEVLKVDEINKCKYNIKRKDTVEIENFTVDFSKKKYVISEHSNRSHSLYLNSIDLVYIQDDDNWEKYENNVVYLKYSKELKIAVDGLNKLCKEN